MTAARPTGVLRPPTGQEEALIDIQASTGILGKNTRQTAEIAGELASWREKDLPLGVVGKDAVETTVSAWRPLHFTCIKSLGNPKRKLS